MANTMQTPITIGNAHEVTLYHFTLLFRTVMQNGTRISANNGMSSNKRSGLSKLILFITITSPIRHKDYGK